MLCIHACVQQDYCRGAYLSLKRQRKQEVSQTSRSSPMRSSTKGRKVSTAWRGRIMRLSLLVSEAVRHLLNSHWHLAGPAHAHPEALRVFILVQYSRFGASFDQSPYAVTCAPSEYAQSRSVPKVQL